MTFQERDILTDRAESCRLRVVTRHPDKTWLFDMTTRNAWPHSVSTPELAAQYDAGDYKKVGALGKAMIGSQARSEALRKHKRFKSGFRTLRLLLSPTGRGICFRALKTADAKLTRRVFDRAVRQWLAGGRAPIAFAPRWDLGGPRAVDSSNLESIQFSEASRHVQARAISIDVGSSPLADATPKHTSKGMPRDRLAPEAPTLYRIDRMTLRVFLHYYEWKLKETGRSLRQAYREMCAEVFVTTNAADQTCDLDLRQIPSFNTFEHWYFDITDHAQRRVGTRGQKNFQLNERDKLGDEVSKAGNAGLVASGDATIWNISIRSRLSGRCVVGPPVVFRIRCKKTGMLLGLAVSLESASWMGMASAIANCLEDKVAFCKRYGIDIRPEDWPINGLMAILEVDRGETDNHHPTAFIELTDVEIENLQAQRPDMKGGCESDWRTLEVRMNGMTPGALIETWEKRNDQKWKLDGVMDIDEFTALLIHHELDRIKKTRPEVNLDDEMIAAGVVRTPLSMWHYDLEHKGGGLISFDKEEVELSLLPRKPATITESGVYFGGCYYLCDELLAEHAFARARIKGRGDVKVAFDPRLADCVYLVELRDEELDVPFLCSLSPKLKHQESYHGKCFAEIRELQQRDAHNSAVYAPVEHASALKTHRAHSQLVAAATERTDEEATSTESNSAQLAHIPQARKEERFNHSPTLALTPKIATGAPSQTATLHDVTKPTTDALSEQTQKPPQASATTPAANSSYRDLLRRANTRKEVAEQ